MMTWQSLCYDAAVSASHSRWCGNGHNKIVRRVPCQDYAASALSRRCNEFIPRMMKRVPCQDGCLVSLETLLSTQIGITFIRNWIVMNQDNLVLQEVGMTCCPNGT